MKRRWLIGMMALVSGLLLLHCRPGKVTPEVSDGCYPFDLAVDVNSGSMDVYWLTECPGLISGYNIYISDKPLVKDNPSAALPSSVEPFNLTPFAGDLNPDDPYEHFEADGLENGRKYFVSVRVVNADGTLSKPSNEVEAVCGARGTMELSIRYKSSQDGYSFDLNEYVSAEDVNNDLYFFSGPDGDYLGSPVRLNGFLKDNRFRKLPFKGSFDDVRGRFSTLSSAPADDKLPIKKGDWIHMRTPDGANGFLQITDISGEGPDRRVRIFFVYNSLTDELVF